MWKRWLFHATDFQSLMYPCFVLYRILGIFPYKINNSFFEASKSLYILSIAIICVCCVLNLIFVHDIIISKTINFGDVTKNLEAVCYYMLSGFIVIVTHVLNSPRMRLLQIILEISSKLPLESYRKLSRLIHVKDILGAIFQIMQGYIYFSKVQVLELNCRNVLFIVFSMYFSLLVFQINMLYMNCVCILKACFKRINDNLAHMQRLLINDVKLCVPRLIYHTQKNQFLLIELRILKKQHLMISDTVQMLNIIFSLQLLPTIVMCFSAITFQLYFYIVRWKDGIFISFDGLFLNVFLTSTMYYIILIILLAWACETGKNQAQEVSTTIHDVLNSTSDEQIKHELQLFSLQILHCANIFSAKGLIVDATLLAGMVGNITTYMLILVQFLITSHSCDAKTIINIT